MRGESQGRRLERPEVDQLETLQVQRAASSSQISSTAPRAVAARLLPVRVSQPPERREGGATALVMAHETPGDRGFALCLPLTEREPLLSGGLVSRSTMACGS